MVNPPDIHSPESEHHEPPEPTLIHPIDDEQSTDGFFARMKTALFGKRPQKLKTEKFRTAASVKLLMLTLVGAALYQFALGPFLNIFDTAMSFNLRLANGIGFIIIAFAVYAAEMMAPLARARAEYEEANGNTGLARNLRVYALSVYVIDGYAVSALVWTLSATSPISSLGLSPLVTRILEVVMRVIITIATSWFAYFITKEVYPTVLSVSRQEFEKSGLVTVKLSEQGLTNTLAYVEAVEHMAALQTMDPKDPHKFATYMRKRNEKELTEATKLQEIDHATPEAIQALIDPLQKQIDAMQQQFQAIGAGQSAHEPITPEAIVQQVSVLIEPFATQLAALKRQLEHAWHSEEQSAPSFSMQADPTSNSPRQAPKPGTSKYKAMIKKEIGRI